MPESVSRSKPGSQSMRCVFMRHQALTPVTRASAKDGKAHQPHVFAGFSMVEDGVISNIKLPKAAHMPKTAAGYHPVGFWQVIHCRHVIEMHVDASAISLPI
eukprot:scaffold76156_cov40-Prasinocladus_malaysianus.AAC.2